MISHRHASLVTALAGSFQGVGHQRCRVHFVRNLLSLVPKPHTDMAAAVFCTIFANPTPRGLTHLGHRPRPAGRRVPQDSRE